MSTVTEIIEAVKQLNTEEKGEFLTRLSEVDFEDAWDRQIGSHDDYEQMLKKSDS